jgi:hypothetical protein
VFEAVLNNFKVFMITWGVILLLNQIFIFGACFAPYCILAALPHTGFIAVVLTYFSLKAEEEKGLTDIEITMLHAEKELKREEAWNAFKSLINKIFNYTLGFIVVVVILYAIVLSLNNKTTHKTSSASTSTTLGEDASNYRVSPGVFDGLYSLYIETDPSDARVQIMDIKPKYYPGIRLKKGRHTIRVSKPGYITEEYYVDINQDSSYTIPLKKKR